jgi:WD40 repeat protein
LVTSLLRVNSLLLSGSGDTSVRVHDLHGAEKTQAWHRREKPRGCVNAIVAVRPSTLVPTKDDGAAETSTGFIATAGADCNIVLSSNGTRLRQSEPAQRHKDTVRALAYLPARELLASGSLDGTVKIWDLELQCIETLQLGEPVVALAAVGEQLLLVAAGTALTLYDLSDGAPRAVGSAIHTAPVQALAVSGDRIYAGDRDGDISSWSTSLELLATRRAHARGVTSLNAELAGALLSTSTDGAVVISDARGLGELRTLRTSSPCYSLAVADGCVMAGLSSKKIAVF